MLNPLFKQSHASDKHCPRCNTPTVDKALRKCYKCNGWLYWYGDDCHEAEERRDAYYVWMTVNGITGWFYKTHAVGT